MSGNFNTNFIEELQRDLTASEGLDVQTLKVKWRFCRNREIAELVSSGVETVVISALERMATIQVPAEDIQWQFAGCGVMRVIQVLDKKERWRKYEFCRVAACCAGENKAVAGAIIRAMLDDLHHALVVAFPFLIPICYGDLGERLRTEPNQMSLRGMAFLACAVGCRAANDAINGAVDANSECNEGLRGWKASGAATHMDIDGFEDAVARHSA